MVFYRLDTDQQATPAGLELAYAGPQPSACWLIGGGPSLAELPCDELARSPLPKMAVNLAGAGRLRPNFWTSYDPTARFHKSVYLDPGILKFVHRRRAMDLVPESNFKVCECPAMFFFDRDPGRGFQQLLDPQAAGIVDWLDSMIQAIDILYRLGFRIIYLAGCELQVQPSARQQARAQEVGVSSGDWSTLSEFLQQCERKGLTAAELDELDAVATYHFVSGKRLQDAARADDHYSRIVQCLRLSRRCLATHGLQLISVTPHSRLNDFFPYQPVEDVLRQVQISVGDPRTEATEGLYTQPSARSLHSSRPMKDVRPPNWQAPPAKKPRPPANANTSTATRASATPTAEITPSAAPELLIEAEGWRTPQRPFQDAYWPPQEAG